MPREIKSPEEVKMGFWLRNLRLAGGIDIDEYLDYLFGSTKYETGDFPECEKE